MLVIIVPMEDCRQHKKYDRGCGGIAAIAVDCGQVDAADFPVRIAAQLGGLAPELTDLNRLTTV
jgi:hypothetical protein